MAEPQSSAARIFGERVRACRLGLGLSQEDMAHLAEIHWTNWGKIERGQSNPSLTTIVRVAGVLGVDPAELIGGITLGDLPDRTHQLTAAELIRERSKSQV